MSQGITYETALALKKAGFPQGGRSHLDLQFAVFGDKYIHETIGDTEARHEDCIPDSTIAAPTLSELIEACAPSEKWMVIMTVTDKGSIAAKMGQTGVGLVPEEAVAKLWLALHPITHL